MQGKGWKEWLSCGMQVIFVVTMSTVIVLAGLLLILLMKLKLMED